MNKPIDSITYICYAVAMNRKEVIQEMQMCLSCSSFLDTEKNVLHHFDQEKNVLAHEIGMHTSVFKDSLGFNEKTWGKRKWSIITNK